MKKIFQFTTIALFSASLFFVACKKDELLKDLKVYVNSDVLMNPLSITFRDGNNANDPINVPITLEITGPDAKKIFSVTGKQKNLVPDKDIFHVAMKKRNGPMNNNPLTFTVTAKAEGYVDAVKTFTLTSKDYNVEKMNLIKISSPPKGITVKTGSTTTTAVQSSDFYLETEAGNDNTEKLGFRIKAGTQFLGGADGKTLLTGSVNVTLAYMSGENLDTEDYLPGGNDGTSQVMELNQKPKKPSTAAVASCSVIDVYVGGIKATNFSNLATEPLQTSMTISDEIENPNNNFAKIQAGDAISIWSMSEKAPIWQEESSLNLTKNANGKFEVKFSHNHLSTWMAGWMIPVGCTIKAYKDPITGVPTLPESEPVLEIASDLNPSNVCAEGGSSYFYTEIIGKRKGRVLGSGYFEFYNGRKLKLSSILQHGASELSGVIKIYSGSDTELKNVLFQQNIVFCNSSTLNIGSALPKFLEIGMSINAECEGLAVVLPSAPFQYRETGETYYRILGYVNSGTGCASNLQKGKKYDFRIAFGGIDKEAKGLIIPAQDSTVIIDYKGIRDTMRWEYQGVNKNKILIKYQSIKIPDELCDEYKNYLKGG